MKEVIGTEAEGWANLWEETHIPPTQNSQATERQNKGGKKTRGRTAEVRLLIATLLYIAIR